MKPTLILTTLILALMFVLVACQTNAPTPPVSDDELQPQICKGGYCDHDPDPPPPPTPPAPPAPAPCPALATASASNQVSSGNFMTTDVRLCTDGILVAITQTRTITWFGGFKGHVLVRYLASDGTVLGTSLEQVFGVDGTQIAYLYSTLSTRSDRWSEAVSATILPSVSSLEVVHSDGGINNHVTCLWCFGW